MKRTLAILVVMICSPGFADAVDQLIAYQLLQNQNKQKADTLASAQSSASQRHPNGGIGATTQAQNDQTTQQIAASTASFLDSINNLTKTVSAGDQLSAGLLSSLSGNRGSDGGSDASQVVSKGTLLGAIQGEQYRINHASELDPRLANGILEDTIRNGDQTVATLIKSASLTGEQMIRNSAAQADRAATQPAQDNSLGATVQGLSGGRPGRGRRGNGFGYRLRSGPLRPH